VIKPSHRVTDQGDNTPPPWLSRRAATNWNQSQIATESPNESEAILFKRYLDQWQLVADGEPVITPTAQLLPVLRRGEVAMLKLSDNLDQKRGAELLAWWGGEGAARILERDENAILIERATATRSLADMARFGDDDEACRILCATADKLHRKRAAALPELVHLSLWFGELEAAAARHGGILRSSFDTAQMLLAAPREEGVLHGDLHHDNVLEFGGRGWLAIDPHALFGEREFEFANIFTNPDLSDPSRPVATQPGCFQRRLGVVAEASNLEPRRLLQWILAWTGLSAAWFMSDDDPLAEVDLRIAALAHAELNR
jgi:streptomycin 6-kinase